MIGLEVSCYLLFIYKSNVINAPQHSLKYSNASLKVKAMEKGIGVRSLTHSILGVKGHVGALRWGLG